jgi:hypothetical protein
VLTEGGGGGNQFVFPICRSFRRRRSEPPERSEKGGRGGSNCRGCNPRLAATATSVRSTLRRLLRHLHHSQGRPLRPSSTTRRSTDYRLVLPHHFLLWRPWICRRRYGLCRRWREGGGEGGCRDYTAFQTATHTLAPASPPPSPTTHAVTGNWTPRPYRHWRGARRGGGGGGVRPPSL